MKKFNSIIDLLTQFPTEKSCQIYLGSLRWATNDDLYCPHCGNTEKIYKFKDETTYKCSACKLKFNSKTGTIFEDTRLPLQKWFLAIYLLTSHKKGISSLQLSKDLNITQKTAWYMLHRIRFIIKTKSFIKPLDNTVEIDETYVGGKNKNRHANKKVQNSQGRSLIDKTPVIGIVERNGELRAFVVNDVQAKTLEKIVLDNVAPNANLMTDEYRAYTKMATVYNHQIVNHSLKQFADGDNHVNTIEGFWSLLKRGIIGIYHFTSKKHLDKYVSEFVFRYNHRTENNCVIFEHTLTNSIGYLSYKELIEKNNNNG